MSRTLAKAAMSLALVVAGAAGCGLHLHRPNDAKQARAATDGFNQLKLDAALTTARANVATLTAAEIETRQKMGNLFVRRDALSVVAFAPVKPSEESPARGWPKLFKETDDALRKYQLVSGNPSTFAADGITSLRLIERRRENAGNLALELRVHESLVKTYTLPGKPATQPTDCAKVPTAAQLLSASAPPGEDPERWSHYRDHIAPACDRIKAAQKQVNDGKKALRRNPDYDELAKQIEALGSELKASEAKEKELGDQYAEAKKKLTDAQDRLANGTPEKEAAKEKQRVDDIKKDIADATKDVEKAVDASRSFPLAAAVLKSDLLTEVVANAKFVSGDTKAPAAEVTKQLVAILEKYPDVAGRLKTASGPGVNVFLLELALQRLEYRKLVEDRATKQDVVAILEAKSEAIAKAATAWGRVALASRAWGGDSGSQEDKDVAKLRDRLDKERVATVLESGDEGVRFIKGAMTSYLAAKLIEDVDLPVFDIRLADRYYRESLDVSGVALEARNDLIRAPLQEITAYHESGIRSEELAALLQAVGVAGIAAGVNK